MDKMNSEEVLLAELVTAEYVTALPTQFSSVKSWNARWNFLTIPRDVLFTQPPARATKLLVPTPQGRLTFKRQS